MSFKEVFEQQTEAVKTEMALLRTELASTIAAHQQSNAEVRSLMQSSFDDVAHDLTVLRARVDTVTTHAAAAPSKTASFVLGSTSAHEKELGLLLRVLGWCGEEKDAIVAMASVWTHNKTLEEWLAMFPPLRLLHDAFMGKLDVVSRRVSKVETILLQKVDSIVAEGIAREIREVNGFCSKTMQQHDARVKSLAAEMERFSGENICHVDKATKRELGEVRMSAAADAEGLRRDVQDIQIAVRKIKVDVMNWQASGPADISSTMSLRASRLQKSVHQDMVFNHHSTSLTTTPQPQQRMHVTRRAGDRTVVGGGIEGAGVATVVPGPVQYHVQIQSAKQGIRKSHSYN